MFRNSCRCRPGHRVKQPHPVKVEEAGGENRHPVELEGIDHRFPLAAKAL